MTETHRQQINITAEPQARPDQCLFRFDRQLYTGTFYTSNPGFAAEWAPFAKAVFDVGNVKGVRIRHAELLVTAERKPDDWRELARAIGAACREHLQSDAPIVRPGAEDAMEGPDQVRWRAQEVIDQQLNPSLAAHGGWVEIQDSSGIDLFLNMGGGCQGCGAAAATMRQGIEVAIRESVPEVGNIYDATDHDAGENPFM